MTEPNRVPEAEEPAPEAEVHAELDEDEESPRRPASAAASTLSEASGSVTITLSGEANAGSENNDILETSVDSPTAELSSASGAISIRVGSSNSSCCTDQDQQQQQQQQQLQQQASPAVTKKAGSTIIQVNSAPAAQQQQQQQPPRRQLPPPPPQRLGQLAAGPALIAEQLLRSYGATSSVNQAMAVVANRWDREVRKQDQELTRRTTVLRQRKISAVLKVENLQKSLRDTSESTDASVRSRMRQVRDLQEEVASLDRELGQLAKEKEESAKRLQSNRADHISTLQQLGLLDEPPAKEPKWRSEAELAGNHASSSAGSTVDALLEAQEAILDLEREAKAATMSRKFTPPFALAAKLLSESRMRSGSDPSLGSLSPVSRSGQQSRLSSESELSSASFAYNSTGFIDSTNSTTDHATSTTKSFSKRSFLLGKKKQAGASSPRAGRKNPLRLLSNAIDFRNRRARTKSEDALTRHQQGSEPDEADQIDGVLRSSSGNSPQLVPLGSHPRLLMLATNDPTDQPDYTLSSSRHSLPNLDTEQDDPAIELSPSAGSSASKSSSAFVSSYATNPRKPRSSSSSSSSVLLPPLENRNSAPDMAGGPSRLQRARARVQGGLLLGRQWPGATARSLSGGRLQQQNQNNSNATNAPPSGKPKLSSRFQSAQKLNSRLLTNLSNAAAGVKRSKTFNISDVTDELQSLNSLYSSSNSMYSSASSSSVSKTLPSKQRLLARAKKNRAANGELQGAFVDKTATMPMPLRFAVDTTAAGSTGTSPSFDSDSTASSRKSSSTSSSSEPPSSSSSSLDAASTSSTETSSAAAKPKIRTEVNPDALEKIAAFEAFAADYFRRLALNPPTPPPPQAAHPPKRPPVMGVAVASQRQRKLSSVEMKDLVL